MGRRSFQRATQPPPPVAAWSVASREVTGPHLRDAELTASTAISRSCERLNFSTDLFCDPPRENAPNLDYIVPSRLIRSIGLEVDFQTRFVVVGGGGSKNAVPRSWSEVGKMDQPFEKFAGI